MLSEVNRLVTVINLQSRTPSICLQLLTVQRGKLLHFLLSLFTVCRSLAKLTYAGSGVNITNGNKLVEAIKPLASSTSRPGCQPVIGGFGGLFDLKATGYSDPILVSGTDGIGTKLKVRRKYPELRSLTNERL